MRQRSQEDSTVVEEVVNGHRNKKRDKKREANEGRPATKLSDAEEHMKEMTELLEAKCLEAESLHDGLNSEDDPDAHPTEIDMVPFLFNPKCFTQTIENILHFSHLVKKGEAAIRKSHHGIVYIRPTKDTDRDKHAQSCELDKEKDRTTQVVMSISMKDWRTLVEAYGLVKGTIPDRNYDKTTLRATNTENESNQTEGSSASPNQRNATLRRTCEDSEGESEDLNRMSEASSDADDTTANSDRRVDTSETVGITEETRAPQNGSQPTVVDTTSPVATSAGEQGCVPQGPATGHCHNLVGLSRNGPTVATLSLSTHQGNGDQESLLQRPEPGQSEDFPGEDHSTSGPTVVTQD